MPKKIVEFNNWCDTCKHASKEEYDDPCNECLNEPFNEDSHKPVNWEENKSQK